MTYFDFEKCGNDTRNVDEACQERGRSAAEEYCDAQGIDPAAAWRAYSRQINIAFQFSDAVEGYHVADYFDHGMETVECARHAETPEMAQEILKDAYRGPDVDGVRLSWTVDGADDTAADQWSAIELAAFAAMFKDWIQWPEGVCLVWRGE